MIVDRDRMARKQPKVTHWVRPARKPRADMLELALGESATGVPGADLADFCLTSSAAGGARQVLTTGLVQVFLAMSFLDRHGFRGTQPHWWRLRSSVGVKPHYFVGGASPLVHVVNGKVPPSATAPRRLPNS
jgi:hypothetical protein